MQLKLDKEKLENTLKGLKKIKKGLDTMNYGNRLTEDMNKLTNFLKFCDRLKKFGLEHPFNTIKSTNRAMLAIKRRLECIEVILQQFLDLPLDILYDIDTEFKEKYDEAKNLAKKRRDLYESLKKYHNPKMITVI